MFGARSGAEVGIEGVFQQAAEFSEVRVQGFLGTLQVEMWLENTRVVEIIVGE